MLRSCVLLHLRHRLLLASLAGQAPLALHVDVLTPRSHAHIPSVPRAPLRPRDVSLVSHLRFALAPRCSPESHSAPPRCSFAGGLCSHARPCTPPPLHPRPSNFVLVALDCSPPALAPVLSAKTTHIPPTCSCRVLQPAPAPSHKIACSPSIDDAFAAGSEFSLPGTFYRS